MEGEEAAEVEERKLRIWNCSKLKREMEHERFMGACARATDGSEDILEEGEEEVSEDEESKDDVG